MKTKACYLLIVLVLAAALPFASAAETKAPYPPGAADGGPGKKFEHRTFPPPPGAPGEKESVTFLGVETAPASPTLSAQLNLPKESGLVIVTVSPESPAAAVLKPHDILLKLSDQLLIDPRQLSVLIRQRNEGDEVALTYVRGGKEATAKVKLGKHDVPKMALMRPEGAGQFDFFVNRREGMPAMPREEMDRVLGLMDRGGHPGMGAAVGGVAGPGPQGFTYGPGFRSTAVNTTNSNMVFSDDQGSLDLTVKEGKKTLVAKNAKGEAIFSGPVDTPEERKALPPEVHERLERIEGMHEFSFRTDHDFQPGEMKVMRAPPQGITMPVPAPLFEAQSPRIF